MQQVSHHRPNTVGHQAPQTTHGRAQAKTGSLQGQPIQQLDAQSVLANAADEMTQAFSSRAQEKSLRDRKLGPGQGGVGLSREKALSLLGELREDAHAGQGGAARAAGGQDDAEALDDALENLTRKVRDNPDSASDEARRFSDDPTEQYLALLELAERISESAGISDPGGRALHAVREAAAELLAEQGTRILADINSQDAGAQLEGRLDRAGFRSVYRDVVIAADDTHAVVCHLLKSIDNGEGKDFREVLKTTQAALGLDLAAARPSTDPVRLRALISDLYHLEVIATTIDHCAALSTTLTRRHETAPLAATKLTADLIALTGERWVDASRFGRLARDFGMQDPPVRAIDFLTGSRNALRELPIQVFSSDESRQTVLEAAQSAIDHAVDREEGFA